MNSELIILLLVIVTALAFDFTNGFHDTGNAMATSIATGALKPKTAVGLSATLNLVGAFLSVEVALTVTNAVIKIQNKDGSPKPDEKASASKPAAPDGAAAAPPRGPRPDRGEGRGRVDRDGHRLDHLGRVATHQAHRVPRFGERRRVGGVEGGDHVGQRISFDHGVLRQNDWYLRNHCDRREVLQRIESQILLKQGSS